MNPNEKDRQKYEDLAQLFERGLKCYHRGYLCCVGIIMTEGGSLFYRDRGIGETWREALLDAIYKAELEAAKPQLRWVAQKKVLQLEANYADDIDECPATERNDL